jgi:glycosyltransferase involved in cell wall biosynthesis
MTLSMLRGDEGNQAREVEELCRWLSEHEHPEVISLSNGLLVGCARRLKQALGALVTVTLQGEDTFLDALPTRSREPAWRLMAQRLAEVDLLVAPSRYYADRMARRLGLARDRIQVVPNGISIDGWGPPTALPDPPALGFFARMCPEKGLDLLVDAFVQIRRGGRVPGLRLLIGGGLGPSDRLFVDNLKRRLLSEGLMGDTEFHPNLSHAGKQAFFKRLNVFSVPAHYGEAFGFYLLEAMAAGVPLVQPDSGAFGEILSESGAGLVSRTGDSQDLAHRIEDVLLNPELARQLSAAGMAAVAARYNSEAAARALIRLYETARQPASPSLLATQGPPA